MSTDRELLELAAKACGWIRYEPDVFEPDSCITWIDDKTGEPYCEDTWNPLIDDGDALRLAVKLSMLVDVPGPREEGRATSIEVLVAKPVRGTFEINQQINDSPYAATRRAIVRAAAEIGRGMP
jgi:hypothetical protein